MKATVNRKEFYAVADFVRQALDPQMGTLAYIKMDVAPDSIRLSSTNLIISLQALVVGAQVEATGSVLVQGKLLADLFKALVGESVLIALRDNKLSVTDGTSRFNLGTLSSEQFPQLPSMVGYAFQDIPAAEFKSTFGRVHFATVEDPSRAWMGGILVSPGRVVASDGHRMSLIKDSKIPANKSPFTVPAKYLKGLLGDMGDEGVVGIAYSTSEMHVRYNNRIASLRGIEDHYPDVEKVIPVTPHQMALVRRQGLISAIKRSILVNTKKDLLKLKFVAPNQLIVSSQGDTSDAEETLEVETSADLEIHFKASYITDVLERCGQEFITLQLRGPTAPVVISEGAYLNVIMPRKG